MKRGFRGFLSRAFAALCFSFFTTCAGVAFAQAAPHDAQLVYLQNDAWQSHLLITCDDAGGCEVRTTNCMIGSNDTTLTLAKGESRVVPNIAARQCNATDVGVTSLRITKGTPSLSTFALRRDAFGNRTAIELHELRYSDTANIALLGRLVQNDENFDTWIAIFSRATAPHDVHIDVYGETNEKLTSEVLQLNPGFNFRPLGTYAHAARIEIRPGVPGLGCATCNATAPIAGVAFVGWRAGGSPRVVELTPIP